MKRIMSSYIAVATFFFLTALLLSCGQGEAGLKIGKWGPQSMVLGDIPNKQPDGGVGIWMEVSREGGGRPDSFQILFAGIPMPTTVTEKGGTTSIPPEHLTQPGNKEIVVKQLTTGKTFPVGTFVINPKQ